MKPAPCLEPVTGAAAAPVPATKPTRWKPPLAPPHLCGKHGPTWPAGAAQEADRPRLAAAECHPGQPPRASHGAGAAWSAPFWPGLGGPCSPRAAAPAPPWPRAPARAPPGGSPRDAERAARAAPAVSAAAAARPSAAAPRTRAAASGSPRRAPPRPPRVRAPRPPPASTPAGPGPGSGSNVRVRLKIRLGLGQGPGLEGLGQS